MLNKQQQMHLKLIPKEQLKKRQKATDGLIGDKIANKTTKV